MQHIGFLLASLTTLSQELNWTKKSDIFITILYFAPWILSSKHCLPHKSVFKSSKKFQYNFEVNFEYLITGTDT